MTFILFSQFPGFRKDMTINPRIVEPGMAKAKTNLFTITARVSLPAASLSTPVMETINLGSYIDVADSQAIAIEEVDFIVQGTDNSDSGKVCSLAKIAASDTDLVFQLSDLNPDTLLLLADNSSLIASGELFFETTAGYSYNADMYPDDFGSLSNARFVVNDNLYFLAEGQSGSIGTSDTVEVIVRIRARVVKLSSKDWMALAIQTVATE